MNLRNALKTLIATVAICASTAAFPAGTIHEATRDGNLQAVEKMVAANRNLVNTKNELGSTPLHIAATNSSPGIAKLLIDKGANVNARDNGGATPLHIAAFTGRKENVQLLLSRGADVNAKDGKGQTPRDYATTVLNREIADILLIKMLAAPAPVPKKQGF